jgi:hypothetical protein
VGKRRIKKENKTSDWCYNGKEKNEVGNEKEMVNDYVRKSILVSKLKF